MDSFVLVIFGITGNLAQLKLIPALYDIESKKMLPAKTAVLGTGRKLYDKLKFDSYIDQHLLADNRHHTHPIDPIISGSLKHKMHYLSGDLGDPNFYEQIKNSLAELEAKGVNCQNRVFYLATYPDLYESIFNNLVQSGLTDQKKGWIRLIIEKPMGADLASAKALNQLLKKYFAEEQVYRLDHYLGKETLQNILTFRFGNDIFEPLINKDHIDHIQITAAEDFGIGKRGGYYDSVGALRDVGQNHLLQMLTFATMDAPSDFTNQAITKQRIEILKNLIPFPKKVILGQYHGYLEEENVRPNSDTDTYFAFKTQINSERFKNVPIYIRGGKRLTRTVTEIAIIFKNPKNRLFKHLDSGDQPNVLIYRIQPNEGIVLNILTKRPGHQAEIDPTFMQFCYKKEATHHFLPDAYERLLMDAIKGDQTFFNDAEEIEAEWAFVDEILKQKQNIYHYEQGGWGPKKADALMKSDGRSWLEPSIDFCRF